MSEKEIKQEPDYVGYEPSNEFLSSCTEMDVPYCETVEVKDEPPDEMVSTESNDMEEDEENLDMFSFKSDHPALKSNSDYKKLIKTIAILEAQRAKAIRDLDKLYELQEEALEDPIRFVEKLQRKENLGIPGPQKIHPIPVIDWSKYSLQSTSGIGRRQLTRLSSKTTHELLKSGHKLKMGKMIDQKPKVNQYWTAEEQQKLEELLIQFPPEEIESRRWVKIANCLENRTPVQVASRVQKYFIKLLKAGMPIPGRMPNYQYMRKPRRNIIRQQPSTFFASHVLPVYMPEDDNDYTFIPSQNVDENSMESKDEDEISAELQDTPEFKELMLLKKIQKEKMQANSVQHFGFKCCQCNMDPIIGVRWHCTECKPPIAIDFCDKCALSSPEIGIHVSSHKLEEIHQVVPNFQERDYMHFLGNDYNYLDPNYISATK